MTALPAASLPPGLRSKDESVPQGPEDEVRISLNSLLSLSLSTPPPYKVNTGIFRRLHAAFLRYAFRYNLLSPLYQLTSQCLSVLS